MTHDRKMDTPDNQQIEHINFTHDPLCGWSSNNDCDSGQPHKEFPEGTNGYRWRICDQCGYECECGLIAKVREDERRRWDGQSVVLASTIKQEGKQG
jgi:hypothetical protein